MRMSKWLEFVPTGERPRSLDRCQYLIDANAKMYIYICEKGGNCPLSKSDIDWRHDLLARALVERIDGLMFLQHQTILLVLKC